MISGGSIKNCTTEYQVEIDQIGEVEWSELTLDFDDATIYQTWSYGVVRWGEKNLSHLILKKNNNIIGMAQLAIKKIPLLNSGIAYIPWGPLWQKKGQKTNFEYFHQLIKAIKQEYVLSRGLLLRITPKVFEYDGSIIMTILSTEKFKHNPTIISNRTLLLDLSPSLEELRKNFSQKWRNQLNRSLKNNLEVFNGVNDELFQIFFSLQKDMQARKEYTPGVDYSEFRLIQNSLPEHLKMKIMVCKFEGKPVCSSIGSVVGETGIYLLGASATSGMKLNGSNLLQWEMIKYFKARGCRFYDLGGINPEVNPGVYNFKRGVAGKAGLDVKHIGQFEYYRRNMSFLIVRIGEVIKIVNLKIRSFFTKIF